MRKAYLLFGEVVAWCISAQAQQPYEITLIGDFWSSTFVDSRTMGQIQVNDVNDAGYVTGTMLKFYADCYPAFLFRPTNNVTLDLGCGLANSLTEPVNGVVRIL